MVRYILLAGITNTVGRVMSGYISDIRSVVEICHVSMLNISIFHFYRRSVSPLIVNIIAALVSKFFFIHFLF